MVYEGMVYRPPSEAYSLIFQVTVGCSHNKCTFCTMFKDKKFHIRKPEAIRKDMLEMRRYYSRVGRIFLADGDALCLANSKLLQILGWIKEIFPECERVSIYGSSNDVLHKTPEELRELKEAGVQIVYIGAESGNPEVLRRVHKNGTREEIIKAVRMIEEAGMWASVTFISGLGGRELQKEHAIDTATMLNEMRPHYASFLTLIIEPPAPMWDDLQEGKIELLKPLEVLDEMELFLENVDLSETCIFRSNHASNYLALKGDLPQDRDRLLAQVRAAKSRPDMLRDESWRGI